MAPLAVARAAVWNGDTYRRLRALIRAERPEIAHFHNIFPLVSPAAYYAARAEGVAVVQTLHNYRLLCVAATMFRDGRPCETCLGRSPWPGVLHACYRHSRASSGVSAGMLAAHRLLGTWRRKVDRYIALTEFARDKFTSGGLPAERIAVKPNFMADPGPPTGDAERRGALFIGRLSEEKGLAHLIEAWRAVEARLTIVGDGPMADPVRRDAPAHIDLAGPQGRDEVAAALRRAAYLVLPSIWYEGFPMVLLEAFAAGLPVIAGRIGSLAELIEDGTTGLLYDFGDAAALAAKVRWAEANPGEMRRMGANARKIYELHYTPETNLRHLMSIYGSAMGAKEQIDTKG